MLDELHTVHTEGAALRTRRFGNAAGRPLLFLHGGLGSMEDFNVLLPGLQHFQCILLDTRGHGGSTLGLPLDYARLAADAEAVIAYFNLAEPVVIGHSDGGIAAIRLAATGHRKPAGLILIATHTDPPPQDMLDGMFARLTARIWRMKFPESVARYEQLNPQADFDRLFEATLSMWRDTSPGNYPADLARNIACPTLVLGGDQDHLIPRDITVDLAKRIPDARLGILPFGSHAMFQEEPEVVLSFMQRFIEALDTAGT